VEAIGVVNSCYPLAWGLDALLGLKEDPDFASTELDVDGRIKIYTGEYVATPSEGAPLSTTGSDVPESEMLLGWEPDQAVQSNTNIDLTPLSTYGSGTPKKGR
jgi:hypothetical protein